MKPADTSTTAYAVQLARYRQMSGSERVELAVQMSEDAREIARAGIRARHPTYSASDVEHALRRLILGDDLFRRAWPAAPVLAP
jgi:hypothetical protein